MPAPVDILGSNIIILVQRQLPADDLYDIQPCEWEVQYMNVWLKKYMPA